MRLPTLTNPPVWVIWLGAIVAGWLVVGWIVLVIVTAVRGTWWPLILTLIACAWGILMLHWRNEE